MQNKNITKKYSCIIVMKCLLPRTKVALFSFSVYVLNLVLYITFNSFEEVGMKRNLDGLGPFSISIWSIWNHWRFFQYTLQNIWKYSSFICTTFRIWMLNKPLSLFITICRIKLNRYLLCKKFHYLENILWIERKKFGCKILL